MNTLKLQASL